MRHNFRNFFSVLFLGGIICLGYSLAASTSSTSKQPPQLHGAYRFERAHWIYVHLQGTPRQIGFQHGYLLAPEIDDAFHAIRLENTHSTHRDW